MYILKVPHEEDLPDFYYAEDIEDVRAVLQGIGIEAVREALAHVTIACKTDSGKVEQREWEPVLRALTVGTTVSCEPKMGRMVDGLYNYNNEDL